MPDMWILSNDTAFLAEQTFLGDRDGADTYVLAVKATHDIAADGTCLPAEDQVPVAHMPKPSDPDKPSSLIEETDFDFMKPGTDIVVLGNAFNADPAGRGEVRVGLLCGPVRKTLSVIGRRRWLHSALGPVLSEPEPFREMPVRWENAFGGTDRQGAPGEDAAVERRNPVGTGYARGIEGIEGMAAPSVFVPGEAYVRWSDRPAPAGFAPIGRHWLPRAPRGGTYGDAWMKTRMPLWALDLDPRFFMAAPDDQQAIPHLRGDEEVRIVNMTPEGMLAFRLPAFRPYANVLMAGRMHRLKLWVSTVAVYPGLRRVVVSWCAALPCQGLREKIRSTEVWDKPLVRRAAATGGDDDEGDEA
ncbi:MAG: DUF2169 domain-containing protein [Paracoccaceae bacterium]